MAVWAEPQASGVAERIDPSGLKILTSRPLVLSYSRTLEMALRPPKGNSQDTTMLPLGAMARSWGAQLRIFDQAPHEEMAISIEYLDGVFADARGAHTRRQEGATIGPNANPLGNGTTSGGNWSLSGPLAGPSAGPDQRRPRRSGPRPRAQACCSVRL